MSEISNYYNKIFRLNINGQSKPLIHQYILHLPLLSKQDVLSLNPRYPVGVPFQFIECSFAKHQYHTWWIDLPRMCKTKTPYINSTHSFQANTGTKYIMEKGANWVRLHFTQPRKALSYPLLILIQKHQLKHTFGAETCWKCSLHMLQNLVYPRRLLSLWRVFLSSWYTLYSLS